MLKIEDYILETDVESVLSKLQLALTNGKLSNFRRTSSGISVPCPFHADGHEQHNSCFITDEGIYHCFTCNSAGTFLKFVAGCFGSSEDYAKNWLTSNFPATKEEVVSIGEDIIIPRKQVKILQQPKQKVVDNSPLDGYQSWCPYLGQRKLSRAVCEKFNVKYDPKYRQVIFPCYDNNGNLITMPRRNIDTKVFYLDKDLEKPLYCMHYIKQKNIQQCMIVEGPIDCLTCWTNGVPAIATMGSVTEEQIQKLNKSNINILYLCFDNDDAGRKFAARVKSKLNRRILTIDVNLPKNRKDVNDLTIDEWENLISTYNLPKFDIKTA